MDTRSYQKIAAYVSRHPVATLSTIDPDGSPHGAVVYVCADDIEPIIYFITKQHTKKYKNLRDRSRVSITIASAADDSTLQADGRAYPTEDPRIIDMVVRKIAQEHAPVKEWLPPLAKIHAGAYEIVRVELSFARLSEFQGMAIGNEHIFTGGEV